MRLNELFVAGASLPKEKGQAEMTCPAAIHNFQGCTPIEATYSCFLLASSFA